MGCIFESSTPFFFFPIFAAREKTHFEGRFRVDEATWNFSEFPLIQLKIAGLNLNAKSACEVVRCENLHLADLVQN